MSKRLSANFMTLVFEAALQSFWRRKSLWRFLRQAGINEGFLATWREDESKRQFLDRLFAKLPGLKGGQKLILVMARDLAQQEAFPDLAGWEDSADKVRTAKNAVGQLTKALAKLDQGIRNEKEREETQERYRALQAEALRSRQDLRKLDQRLNTLAETLGSQAAGYGFQDWFYELMDFFEVVNRRPYATKGRQIDGSITVTGTTYLVELKFTQDQAGAPDVDSLRAKVAKKADNTMGLMMSISGYSTVAIEEASGPRTTILLMDHGHIYLALGGTNNFGEIVERVSRHASQTGEAYLPAAEF